MGDGQQGTRMTAKDGRPEERALRDFLRRVREAKPDADLNDAELLQLVHEMFSARGDAPRPRRRR